jgi:hypothetical protein
MEHHHISDHSGHKKVSLSHSMGAWGMEQDLFLAHLREYFFQLFGHCSAWSGTGFDPSWHDGMGSNLMLKRLDGPLFPLFWLGGASVLSTIVWLAEDDTRC